MKFKLAFLCYLLVAIVFLATGVSFVFATEFFPFHSDVIETAWQDLGKSEQTLYLGMMRTEGAGFLAAAMAIALLLFIPFRRREAWSYWAMTAIGITEWLPTFLANLHVANTTPASPPWQLALGGMIVLVVGLVLSIAGSRSKSI